MAKGIDAEHGDAKSCSHVQIKREAQNDGEPILGHLVTSPEM
ncbi:hypothetical protein CtesDRAFT_PD2409 [Comamonas testosteroni KF-1]|uniref:Uncharacterized protein n=1 Tax=Comamonas testosteroni (strain DSM 14576 / KF-1) TaxID=399795 RepID=B7WTQ7_COMTK|nr:hypothetical protein CtesDRAFT_PD2409 [Comamonas testosteroni KF-1]